jgi:hypothetical protein
VSFNYKDYHLTYFVDGMGGWFQDELEGAIANVIRSFDVDCNYAVTANMTELTTDRHGQKNAKIAFRGFYCVFAFRSDEDRSLFKLSMPSDCELKQQMIEILHNR